MQDMLGEMVWKSLTAPRDAARVLLAMRLGWGEVLLVIAAGISIDIMLAMLQAMALSAEEAAQPLVRLAGLSVVGVVLRTVTVFLSSGIAIGVGRMFGVRAGFLRVVTSFAWVGLVSSLLGVVQLIGLVLFVDVMVVIMFGLMAVTLWMLSSFLAEAFAVASAGKVAGVLVGVVLGLTLLLAILAAMTGALPEVR